MFGGGVPDTIANGYTCAYGHADCISYAAADSHAVCGGISDTCADCDACAYGYSEPGAYGQSDIGCVSYAAADSHAVCGGVPDTSADCDTCAHGHADIGSEPLPTATPLSVVFPTPLPTATPAPTSTPIAISRPGNRSTDSPAFLYIEAARVMPLYADGFGVGFWFESNQSYCRDKVCLMTTAHTATGRRLGLVPPVWDGSAYPTKGVRLSGGVDHQDISLDIAVVPAGPISDVPALDGLTKWAFAPRDSVEVGDSVRVVTFDFHAKERTDEGVAIQMVLDGIVSRITKPGEEFSLTTSTLPGNSGGVVLNEAMQVIGMVKAALQYRHPFGAAPERIPFRTYAVHVDAIRDKLCEWGYLTGSDCR